MEGPTTNPNGEGRVSLAYPHPAEAHRRRWQWLRAEEEAVRACFGGLDTQLSRIYRERGDAAFGRYVARVGGIVAAREPTKFTAWSRATYAPGYLNRSHRAALARQTRT